MGPAVKWKDKSQFDNGLKQKDIRRDQDWHIYANKEFLHDK